MPGLVDDGVFDVGIFARHQPSRADREHASGIPCRPWQSARRVSTIVRWPYGIRAEPFAVVSKRRPCAFEMARRLRRVLGLKQQTHVDRRQSGMLEALARLEKIRARRPREVVHILLIVPMRRRAVWIIGALALPSGSRKRPPARNGHAHVVHAEIGEELRADMKLMAVPRAGRIEHADLGKPLRDEEVVADGAGARERARNFRRKGDVERHRLARADRLRQRDRHHGAVVLVAVVRSDEAHLSREIGRRDGAACDRETRDVDGGTIFGALRRSRAATTK